ncbi:MAG: hypothetical protein ACT4OO_01150 [Nitrospiraceae bacterium]
MSYRYTTIDIIVGVGMCAIVLGALLFFVAANGTFQVAALQPIPVEQNSGVLVGMTLLQPALGQAIVEHVLLERRADRGIAEAAVEWNRATLAHHDLQSTPGSPFMSVMRDAVTVPGAHAARVQSVMGRAIVNFTKRGIRSEVLSADQYLSGYNDNMIHATEARGQRLDQEFSATWQAILGHRIVEAARDYSRLVGSIQERLGAAILHMTQAQTMSEEAGAENQDQLGSLVVAAIRTDAVADRVARLAGVQSTPEEAAIASSQAASWPEIPMGYLMAAALGLAAIFFGGLSLAATGRERKALAEMRHENARWVYRLAA